MRISLILGDNCAMYSVGRYIDTGGPYPDLQRECMLNAVFLNYISSSFPVML